MIPTHTHMPTGKPCRIISESVGGMFATINLGPDASNPFPRVHLSDLAPIGQPITLDLTPEEARELRECIDGIVSDLGTVVADDEDRPHLDRLQSILSKLQALGF